MDLIMARFNLLDRNRIKLGIGETVRVLLRRMPHVVLLSEQVNPIDASLILRLAKLRKVTVLTEKGLAFDAIAIISTAI